MVVNSRFFKLYAQFVARTFEEKSVGNKSKKNVLILSRIRFKNAASAMAFVQAMGPILGVLFGKALLRVYKTTLIWADFLLEKRLPTSFGLQFGDATNPVVVSKFH